MARKNIILQALREGKIVVYPTESFYALGVDATNTAAVGPLFHLKHRQHRNPIALVASSLQQVQKYFRLTPQELMLARKYWPGAVTIVLTPRQNIAWRALGARRIGVRVPDHAVARGLARSFGAPITATSANTSGHPPHRTHTALKKEFSDILVVSGRCGYHRRPSTVVEIVKHKLIVHRPGAVHVLLPAA